MPYSKSRLLAIPIGHSTGTYTDADTFYFGSILTLGNGTPANRSKVYFPSNGIITGVVLFVANGNIPTTETIEHYVRVNDTTDYLISTELWERWTSIKNLNMNVPIATGDYIQIKVVTPTWVTDPTSTNIQGYLVFKAK
jgi:hypothetical protein